MSSSFALPCSGVLDIPIFNLFPSISHMSFRNATWISRRILFEWLVVKSLSFLIRLFALTKTGNHTISVRSERSIYHVLKTVVSPRLQ